MSRDRAIARAIRLYTSAAQRVLRGAGLVPHFTWRHRDQLVWTAADIGDRRTLVVLAYHDDPVIVRFALDNYQVSVTKRTAATLGTDARAQIAPNPARMSAEINVLPDEADAAIAWALGKESRGETLPPIDDAPFAFEPQGSSWQSLWSKRAAAVYWAAYGRHVPRPPEADTTSGTGDAK